MGVENEINANSAFNLVEVEVEAELGKNVILTFGLDLDLSRHNCYDAMMMITLYIQPARTNLQIM